MFAATFNRCRNSEIFSSDAGRIFTILDHRNIYENVVNFMRSIGVLKTKWDDGDLGELLRIDQQSKTLNFNRQ